ncbi:Na+/H+ antiporter NhaC family protein [Isachenkonia alkalipeptolytica]|uniref:Na+/H+ antiporter NhaC-like C-terminal domain-containing protein n=1 Tax=Isachenkonia alkalipeptolytica TaxID=2565777 RepID=A0AA43XI76_9CLOT|nr:Na+/H+ antiporter NhaC family protein [Isachenkonia alkalipeptolytica]NBG86941.1 hypothetical protein [Isachenkonia alkalipeptolytica]
MREKISIRWAFIIGILFISTVITAMVLQRSLVWGIYLTLLFSLLVLYSAGISPKISLGWILQGVYDAKEVYGLIILIGLNVSMWIASGIVPTLLYFGFDMIHGVNFLPFAFIISGVLAFFLGTGLGTISTIGIVLFTLGVSINIPGGLLLGTLVSGAYIADRMSPISALANFTMKVLKISFRVYFVKMLKVMVPTTLLSLAVYYFIGLNYQGEIQPGDVAYYQGLLGEVFILSPLLLLIPLGVLWLSFKKLSSSYVLLFGILTGFMAGVGLQGMSLYQGLRFLILGFESPVSSEFMGSLEIGGALQMLEVVLVVMGGIAISKIYEGCGWIAPVIERVKKKSKTRGQLLLNTGLLSIVLNALTCDQTVGILVPGTQLPKIYQEQGLSREDLGVMVANSGTALAPLMPWNVNAIIIYTITGVSALSYGKFAVLNWLAFPAALFTAREICRILSNFKPITYKN